MCCLVSLSTRDGTDLANGERNGRGQRALWPDAYPFCVLGRDFWNTFAELVKEGDLYYGERALWTDAYPLCVRRRDFWHLQCVREHILVG
jgi:hypothetical protein